MQDKIKAALIAALKHLEDSTRALSGSKDKKGLTDSLWSAMAETEYAVFLLSLTQGDKAENAPWKHSPISKQSIEFEPAVTSSNEFLRNAKASVEAGNFEKGYEETWTARNLLLKAHEHLEKKQKEARK